MNPDDTGAKCQNLIFGKDEIDNLQLAKFRPIQQKNSSMKWSIAHLGPVMI